MSSEPQDRPTAKAKAKAGYIPYAGLTEEQREVADSEEPLDRMAAAQEGFGLDKLVDDPDWSVRRKVAEQGYDPDSRPELPKGWSYIADLQAGLDLGKHGELELPTRGIDDALNEQADAAVSIFTDDLYEWIGERDNGRWMVEAKAEGLLDGAEDFEQMISMAQYLAIRDDLRERRKDVLQNAILDHLKEEHGAIAVSDELAGRIGEIDCSDAGAETFEALFDAADAALAETVEEDGVGLMTLGDARAAAALSADRERASGLAPDRKGAVRQVVERSREDRQAGAPTQAAPERAGLGYEVYENNGGGIALMAFEGDEPIWAGHGYEHRKPAQIINDIRALEAGENPVEDGWETDIADPQALRAEFRDPDSFCELIADDEGIYRESMGVNGRRLFSEVEPSEARFSAYDRALNVQPSKPGMVTATCEQGLTSIDEAAWSGLRIDMRHVALAGNGTIGGAEGVGTPGQWAARGEAARAALHEAKAAREGAGAKAASKSPAAAKANAEQAAAARNGQSMRTERSSPTR